MCVCVCEGGGGGARLLTNKISQSISKIIKQYCKEKKPSVLHTLRAYVLLMFSFLALAIRVCSADFHDFRPYWQSILSFFQIKELI